MTSPHLKAVIFDIGGVVCQSPFVAIAQYEREKGLPPNYLNVSISGRGSAGAWQKFERGQLPLLEFYNAFGADLSDTVSGNAWYASYCKRRGISCPPLPATLSVDGRELFGRMMHQSVQYDMHVLRAMERLRASGRWKLIALTNNFSKHNVSADGVEAAIPESELQFLGWHDGAVPSHLRDLFDDFCDSSTLGVRKPDPEIYLIACNRNGIKPSEAIFLDDIGVNLKTARELGMETIHVPLGRTLHAVKQLESKLDIDLTTSDDIPRAKL